jgi:hypothetical protein
MIPAEGLLKGKGKVQEEEAEKEIGSHTRSDEHGVLSEPAQPCPVPQIPLQNRPGIHISETPNGLGQSSLPGRPTDPGQEFLESSLHQIMVILPTSVPGHDPP